MSIYSKNTSYHKDPPSGPEPPTRPEAVIRYADASDVLLKLLWPRLSMVSTPNPHTLCLTKGHKEP